MAKEKIPPQNRYEVLVKFDDRIGGSDTHKPYFKTMDKYNAMGIGHDRTSNSSLFIETTKPLNRTGLQRELGEENKILRISKI